MQKIVMSVATEFAEFCAAMPVENIPASRQRVPASSCSSNNPQATGQNPPERRRFLP
jgi:hypothetical protein